MNSSKIQPEQGSSKSTHPEPKKIPNGWAQVPHSIYRDPTLSDGEVRLMVELIGRQGQHQHVRVGLKVLAQDMGCSTRTVITRIQSVQAKGLITVKKTGRTNYYTVLKPTSSGSMIHSRGEAGFTSTEQEVMRKKKAKQLPALTTEGAPSRAPTRRVESLSTTATDKTAMRAELLLLSLPAQQRPALTNRTLKAFSKLFDMGYSEPEVLAHLKETITNPNARAGLTVETLEALAQIPHRESNTAPHTATKAEQQAQELEEVWGTQGEPQEQIDQFEENSQEWIATIRADLNKRKNRKVSA